MEIKQRMVSVSTNNKDILVSWFGSDSDTGSTQAQIALLTARISMITKHIEINKKDFSSKRGLLKLVGQRRRLLVYLAKQNPALCEDVKAKMKLQ